MDSSSVSALVAIYQELRHEHDIEPAASATLAVALYQQRLLDDGNTSWNMEQVCNYMQSAPATLNAMIERGEFPEGRVVARQCAEERDTTARKYEQRRWEPSAVKAWMAGESLSTSRGRKPVNR